MVRRPKSKHNGTERVPPRDLINVGIVTREHLDSLSPALAARLLDLLDPPEG